MEMTTMKPFKQLAIFSFALLVMLAAGCASTAKHEGTGEYIDDAVITAKVKAAFVNDPGLKATEINVETFKGVVQLSGFVAAADNIRRAAEVARGVKGVKQVKNDIHLK
jgi:osmotically-inducible protein OsmY